MNCSKCTTQLAAREMHEHNGLPLCEDCYIDAVSILKTCDPWAVYSASRTVTKDVGLTGEQQRIIELLKAKGQVALEEICGQLGLDENEFRTHFSTLRHMQLVGACKKGGQIFFTLSPNLNS